MNKRLRLTADNRKFVAAPSTQLDSVRPTLHMFEEILWGYVLSVKTSKTYEIGRRVE